MWHTKNAFFRETQFWSHCYTVVSYQALFRLSVYKIPAIYLSGAKKVCFRTIRDFGSPTNMIRKFIRVSLKYFSSVHTPANDNLVFSTLLSSKGLSKPAQLRSFAIAFTARMQKVWMKNKTKTYQKPHSIYLQDVLGGFCAYKKNTKISCAGPYAFVCFI